MALLATRQLRLRANRAKAVLDLAAASDVTLDETAEAAAARAAAATDASFDDEFDDEFDEAVTPRPSASAENVDLSVNQDLRSTDVGLRSTKSFDGRYKTGEIPNVHPKLLGWSFYVCVVGG
jgi:hypothetical protein